MLDLAGRLITASGQAAMVAGFVVGAFVLFTGVTLGVALFHPKEDIRRHAAEILPHLLRLFDRRRS
jgi:hypothetical protein